MFYSIKAKKKCDINFFFNGNFTPFMKIVIIYFNCSKDNIRYLTNTMPLKAFFDQNQMLLNLL